MSDTWRYEAEDQKTIEKVRRYHSLRSDCEILNRAMAVLDHFEGDKRSVEETEALVRTRMLELKPAMKTEIKCDSCWGARREGHGERCGRCGGSGTIPAYLHVCPPAGER